MNIKKLIILLNLISFIFASCEFNPIWKENDNPQLPPVTKTGEHTLGFKLNGKVVVSEGSLFDTRTHAGVNGKYLSISGEDWRTGGEITLRLFGDTLAPWTWKVPGVYYLEGKDSINSGFITDFQINPDADYFVTDSKRGASGEVHISKLDPANGIISGTFWFDAINNSGDVVEIRDGRFDISYIY